MLAAVRHVVIRVIFYEKCMYLPYNSDMHDQTSQPLGSFNGREKKANTKKVFLILNSKENCGLPYQLTSVYVSPRVSWPLQRCIMLQEALVSTVRVTL